MFDNFRYFDTADLCKKYNLFPIVYNVNIGHSSPKCIVPFGVTAYVDTREQVIRFEE